MHNYIPPTRQRGSRKDPSLQPVRAKGGLATRRRLCLAFALATCLLGAKSALAQPTNPAESDSASLVMATVLGAAKPIDWRHRIEAAKLTRSGNGAWTSPIVKAAFPFNELIYYWNVRLPKDQGFRLYLQAEFGPGDASPWLYAGFWGNVKLTGKRSKPSFERGLLDEDTLLLKAKATGFRFRVVDEGEAPLTALPALGVISTDTAPTAELAARYLPKKPSAQVAARILDVPLRLQVD